MGYGIFGTMKGIAKLVLGTTDDVSLILTKHAKIAAKAAQGSTSVIVDDGIVNANKVQEVVKGATDSAKEEMEGLTREQYIDLQNRISREEDRIIGKIRTGCMLIAVPLVPLVVAAYVIPYVSSAVVILGGSIFVYEAAHETNHALKKFLSRKKEEEHEEHGGTDLGIAKWLFQKSPLRLALPFLYKKYDQGLPEGPLKKKIFGILDFNVILLSEIVLAALTMVTTEIPGIGIGGLMFAGAVGTGIAVAAVSIAGKVIAPIDNKAKIMTVSTNAGVRKIGDKILKYGVPAINFGLKALGTGLLLGIGAHMIMGAVSPLLGLPGLAHAGGPIAETAFHLVEHSFFAQMAAGFAAGNILLGGGAAIGKIRSLVSPKKPEPGHGETPPAKSSGAASGPAPAAKPENKQTPGVKNEFGQNKTTPPEPEKPEKPENKKPPAPPAPPKPE
jgi:predicted DNA repair protein MutK